MEIDVKPGVYVVAVSGGVDSMVLLHLLAQRAESREQRNEVTTQPSALSPQPLRLVVAHFDHGMRPGSEKDRQFVQHAAEKHGLPFVYAEGRLGPKASEERARTARYKFLEKVRKAAGAKAIITAHHQDDALETAIINMLRGTGRLGLTSLNSKQGLVRPLLDVPKKDLLVYAKKHKIAWREDPTNQDTDYLRNYVRHELLPKFGQANRAKLLGIITNLRVTNKDLDSLIADILGKQAKNSLDRHMFTMLAHQTAKELMAAWLRQNSASGFTQQTLERLVRAAKVYRSGKQTDINGKFMLEVKKDKLALVHRER